MEKKPLYPGQMLYRISLVLLLVGMGFGICAHIFRWEFALAGPCFLNEYMHLYCPGCGGTRALFALFRLDLVESVCCNPLVLYMAGLFLYYVIGVTLSVRSKGRRIYFRPGWWMLIVFLLLLLWTFVGRNLLAVFCGVDYLGDVAGWWNAG